MTRGASAKPSPLPDEPSIQTPAERWHALFGTPAPEQAGLAELAVAWKEQVLVLGDISPAVRRDLLVISGEISASRIRSGGKPVAASSIISSTAVLVHHAPVTKVASAPCVTDSRKAGAALPPASSQLHPGAKLVKAYGGRNHVVEVTEDGLLYEGELFASLSAVAKHITGTHWNGLLFFGLRKRKTYTKAKP